MALTSISAAVDMNVNFFLLGDSVNIAKEGQNTPGGHYNLEKMLHVLMKQEVDVDACCTCLRARGLVKEDLVEGVQLGSMIKLCRWIKKISKVLSF